MSAAARTDLRRGACPGLSAPMQTGDGLLARLLPAGTITLDAMAGLGAAARRYGNGIVEVTSRGSFQVRGLTQASAPAFAEAVARLGIAAHDGVPVIADPLAGLDLAELIDAGALAAALRGALATQSFATPLAAKISVAVDGGGALHLDGLAADVRLRAMPSPDGARIHVALGGDAASAMPFDSIAPADAVDTVMRLLRDIAARGPQARARDAIRPATIDAPGLPRRAAAEPIGRHRLRGDCVAIGVGLPFGHADAAMLDGLIGIARGAAATGLRTAPGRALLIVGIAAAHAAALVAAAENLGVIVQPDDPRRRVVACAGAPICAAGEIAARALAPDIARTVAPLLAPDDVIHVSGCAKGCAHHGPAALTVIGRDKACDLLRGGAAAGTCTVGELPRRLAALAQPPQGRARHG
jgi:precorrin-3B synthase